MIYYAGCNLHINRGNHPDEPEGTATAMHDCGRCENLSYCPLKLTEERISYGPEIRAKMDADWRKMREEHREGIF